MNIRAEKIYKNAPADSTVMLREMSFELREGEHVLVTGPSGSGKTTLLFLLSGLLLPTGGELFYYKNDSPEVRLSSKDVLRDGAVSMMFQENRLLPELTQVRNIQVVLPKNEARDEERIRAHLRKLLPEQLLRKPVAELSGGEKRRTALVRAVVAAKNILLLDEPFTGLDEKAMEAAIRYIEEETRGKTLLLTDHEGAHFSGWRQIVCK